MTSPHDQSQYQVRFDWGLAGAETVAADVDVIVLVDALAPVPQPGILALGPAVVAGDLRNRTAVAEWVLARQAEKGDRFAVAVIAAGGMRGAGARAGETRADAGIRFAVEDLLAAGAVVDALAAVGIDYCSPEAAAACAAFTGLRRGVGHLVSASASGKELIESGRASETAEAAEVDASTVVPVLKE